MITLRKGAKGAQVKTLQRILKIQVDGHFGPKTEKAVELWQAEKGLFDDGIVGPLTWEVMGKIKLADPPLLQFKKIRTLLLREDAANAVELVYEELDTYGAVMPDAGGLRRLKTKATKNRSPVSMHYPGLAFDLDTREGLTKKKTNNYWIEKKGRNWIVWVRCTANITETTIQAWDHISQSSFTHTGKLINLTALLKSHGFKSIRARRSYSRTNYGGSEWWHFQFEKALKKGVSTFGGELMKVYPEEKVRKSAQWRFRKATFGVDWN